MRSAISGAEQRFLMDGIAQGMRNDGRGCFDCRRISFEVGTLPGATASCRLRAGETDIIVGVKCEMSKPSRAEPDRGSFQISVDFAASVSRSLVDGRDAEEMGHQLSVLLESLCAGDDIVDRKQLGVLSGTFAWEVHADVLILASGGNLLDSVSLALMATLCETRLPKVEIVEAVEEGEVVQLRVDDRLGVGPLFPLKRVPLCVTVSQIRDRFLFDVTKEEELCTEAMICVVVDAKTGDVTGLHKLGRGLFDTSSLPAMLERCKATAAALMQQMERELALPAVAA